jgi:hypothetical protein
MNGTPAEGRWGRGCRQPKKLSLQDLYPQPGRKRACRRRARRGRCSLTWPPRNVTPTKGRWGVVSNDAGGSRKNIAAGPISPRAGEERDSGKRTMGVGQILSTSLGKLCLQDLSPLSLLNPSERHCSSTTCSCVPLEGLAHHFSPMQSSTTRQRSLM